MSGQRSRSRLSDVARSAGVSTMTVTRALREPGKVSPATLDRVRAAIEATGYVPDLVARSLASRTTGVVAMIVPSLANSLIAEVTQGMSQAFLRHGRQLMVGATNYSAEEEEALIRTFLARRVDAIYVTGTSQTPGALALLSGAGIPVMQGGNISDPPVDMAVGTSNLASSRDLVTRMIARYGAHVANLSGVMAGNDRMRDRRRGFLEAMANAGAPVPDNRLAEVPISMDGGKAGIRQLLAGRPRAVFCSSDVLAAGALLECQRQAIAVPGEIAIAGYDDLDIAAHLRPSLTTVRIPRFGIGERAAQMIDDALAGRPVRPRSVDMGYEIMMRESA